MSAQNNDLEIVKFYGEQRDKHVKQLMAINGQGTFGALGIVGAVLFGVLGLKKGDLPGPTLWFFFCFGIMVLGIILLGWAYVIYSKFHTSRARRFERLMNNTTKPEDWVGNMFELMPDKTANLLVFLGLVMLLIGTMAVLFTMICQATTK